MSARRQQSDSQNPESEFGADFELGTDPATDMVSSIFRAAHDSTTDVLAQEDVVVVDVGSNSLKAQVLAALAGCDLLVAGADVLADAALVIADASADVASQLAILRRHARPDAAILLVLETPSAETFARAHEAGAFACLRPPLVPEELRGLLQAALRSRAARVHAADLARKLDLESHLASIGRMSAGLSHEVSGPLGAATLNMDAVQRQSARLVETVKGLVWASDDELPARLAAARELITHVESPHGLDGAIRDTMLAHQRLRELFAMMRGLVGRSHGVRREPVDLWSLIPEVRKMLANELAGVEVEVIGEPLWAIADRTLLGQLLQNLISNAAQAAKLLSAPRVRLHVYRRDTGAVVSVRDNGPGIAPDQLERIFEPFFTTRRGSGGIGLGLALCREYALQMHAELSVWSLPGRGACFRVYLPESAS